MSLPIQIYSADSKVKRPKEVVRSMLSGMLRSPYVAYRLVVKDVKTQYAHSVFGMFWDLVEPLVLGAVFYFLMKYRAISVDYGGMSFTLFIVYGMLLYQTFSDTLIKSLDLFKSSKTLLTQLQICPEALLQAVFLRVLFDSSFRIVVMLLVAVLIGPFSAVGFLKFLALYPLIIFFGMSLGVFLAPFNVIYNDVGRVTRIILFPLRYLTPVVWPIPVTGMFAILNDINPITAVLVNLRDLATSNQMSNLPVLATQTALLTCVFLVGWFIFHISIPVLAERA